MQKRYDYNHFEDEYFLHQEQILKKKMRDRIRAKKLSGRDQTEALPQEGLEAEPRPRGRDAGLKASA